MVNTLKWLSVTVLAAWSTCGSLAAQDTLSASLPSQWTLANCIAYANQKNIQVTTLQLTGQTTQQNLLEAKAQRLPLVSGSATQEFVNSKNINPIVGGFQSQASFSGNYGVNANMTLFNGGYLGQNIKASGLEVQLADLNVVQTQDNITLTVTQDFLNILLAKENIVYLQDQVNTSQAQLKQGQQEYAAGSLSRVNFLQLESEAAADQYSLESAENSLQLNIVALKQQLELPTGYDFEVAVPDTLIVAQASPSLDEGQKQAQMIRPEVKTAGLGIQLAQVDLQEVKAQQLPSLSLGGGLLSGYSNNENYKYFTQINDNFYQELGLTLSVPIYSRRLYKTEIENDKIAIEQAKLALQNAQINLNATIEEAYVNLKNAQAQYISADTAFVTSQESYDITNQEFKLGAINLVALLQEKTLYIQALQQYIQAKYTAILNYKIYNFYTGTPITL